jgi:ubiquitin C-terminal hydrolase
MSCPQIYETMAKICPDNDLYKFWSASLRGESIADNHIVLWKKMLEMASKRKDKIIMDQGQQDAHEGFMFLLDMFPNEVQNLFTHTYKTTTGCENCKNIINKKLQAEYDLVVPPECKNLQEYVKSYVVELKGFSCKKCGVKDKQKNYSELVGLREVIFIILKKYHHKTQIEIPLILKFLAADKKHYLVYKLVAQSIHSGSMGGGHYNAICSRADGVKNLNDSSVSPANFISSPDVYLVFYSYMGKCL